MTKATPVPTTQVAQNPTAVPEQKLDVEYFLNRFADFKQLALPHPDERTILVSSHTNERGNEDTDAFVGEYVLQGKKWRVLLDQPGPGCITRFWLTGHAQGNLRFYFDNEAEPRIETSIQDFFGGKYAYLQEFLVYQTEAALNSYTSYFPILFNRHCTIMTDSETPDFQYQVNVLMLLDQREVETFDPAQSEAMTKSVSDFNERVGLGAFTHYRSLPLRSVDNIQLAPKAKRLIVNLPGPAAIDYLQFQLNKMEAEVTSNLRMEIFWDNLPEAAVNCTLTQFFGHSQMDQDWATYPMGFLKESRQLYSRFYMPFQRSAQIYIENLGDETISLDLKYHLENRSSPEAMYFFARTDNRKLMNGMIYPFYECEGMGNFVGMNVLTASEPFEPKHFYFEGDEYFYVDGESQASWRGTGADNYFNTNDRMGGTSHFYNPIYACLWKSDKNGGMSSALRFQFLDAIPFQSSLLMLKEIGSPPMYLSLDTPNTVWADYAWTCYWYAKPSTQKFPRQENVLYYAITQTEDGQPTRMSPVMVDNHLQIKLPEGTWWVHTAPIWDMEQIDHIKEVVAFPKPESSLPSATESSDEEKLPPTE